MEHRKWEGLSWRAQNARHKPDFCRTVTGKWREKETAKKEIVENARKAE
jgi:hypothetical protein